MSSAVTKTQNVYPRKFRKRRGKCGSATKSVARLISVARGILTNATAFPHKSVIEERRKMNVFMVTYR